MSARAGELDFSALRQEAQKAFDTEPTEVVQVAATEETQVQPKVEQIETKTEVIEPSQVESVQTPSQVSPTEQVVELKDDHKVKVKIDGQETTLTYGEYKDILRKNATITQRFQEFAKSKNEFNDLVNKTLADIEAREKMLQEQSQRKDPLYDTLVNALKGQVEPKPRDPNEIVTLADIQKEKAAWEKEFEQKRLTDRQEFEKMVAETAQTVQTRAQIARERQQYMNGLNDIINSDPKYKALGEVIPNLTASVMYHVQSMAPQNLEEALEHSKAFIQDRAEVLAKIATAREQEQQKTAVKQKMESNDGAPVVIQGKTKDEKVKQFLGKSGKLNWDAMAKDSLARFNSMN